MSGERHLHSQAEPTETKLTLVSLVQIKTLLVLQGPDSGFSVGPLNVLDVILIISSFVCYDFLQ